MTHEQLMKVMREKSSRYQTIVQCDDAMRDVQITIALWREEGADHTHQYLQQLLAEQDAITERREALTARPTSEMENIRLHSRLVAIRRHATQIAAVAGSGTVTHFANAIIDLCEV